jgi:hypothetical protein
MQVHPQQTQKTHNAQSTPTCHAAAAAAALLRLLCVLLAAWT